MKLVVTILASVSLLVLLSVLVSTKQSSKVYAQPLGPSSAAVIMLCRLNGFVSPPGPFNVVVATNSSNAPTISYGTNCAQVLADLFSSGFQIKSTQPFAEGEGVVYTLINQVDKQGKDK